MFRNLLHPRSSKFKLTRNLFTLITNNKKCYHQNMNFTFLFKDLFIHSFILRERGREGEKEGEKHQSAAWPITQACALTKNWTLRSAKQHATDWATPGQGWILLFLMLTAYHVMLNGRRVWVPMRCLYQSKLKDKFIFLGNYIFHI